MQPSGVRFESLGVLRGRGCVNRDGVGSSFEQVLGELEEIDSNAAELNTELHRMVGSSFGVVMFNPKSEGHWN